jgi:hypothetical protein
LAGLERAGPGTDSCLIPILFGERSTIFSPEFKALGEAQVISGTRQRGDVPLLFVMAMCL